MGRSPCRSSTAAACGPLYPDLVVELASTSGASPSDEGPRGLTALRQKMAAYQRNGARLGWLLIPAERAVEIWAG
jgi:Uma2 family endonuclease